MPSNLFLTGPRGIGKTTLLWGVLGQHQVSPGGFAVEKVYRHGRRVALDLVDLSSGRRAGLAGFSGHRPVVDHSCFLTVGVPAIAGAMESRRVVVMDELGRFELAVPAFMHAVMAALDSPLPVVGVIKDESNPFLDAVRARPDVRVIRLDPRERAAAEAEFAGALRRLLEGWAGTG